MKCPRCQHENEAGAKFCEECAALLARTCGNCGRQLSPMAKFCPECAHPTGLAPTAPTAPRFASPESYTPKHLAERILTSKGAVEGERKQVTVLFADMKGSMELLADRDPEDARTILDPVLGQMMEAVHRYEGTVNQVLGDGIMALFGAPIAHEDHAIRGCYAALRMQEVVKRYAEELHRTAGVPIQIRIGLNSGEVVVRSIGNDLHVDYTAVGQTTHLAARMEQMAMPGSILITPETLSLAEGYVVVNGLGPRSVKGLPGPIEVYELIGAGAARSRLQAAAARGLTKFVGRAAEVRLLGEALARAGAGRGQVVAVVGEPGVGKSRLYWEFTHSHRTQGWLVLESSSVSYGRTLAYLPIVELLRGYFQLEVRDDARKVREKVTGKILSLDRQLEPWLTAFLWLLDVAGDDPQWEALDPPQRRHRTLEGIRRLLLRESQVQPVVLLFEDLHWIDGETQALLNGLVESLPTARLLLLVNYRPEYQHGWAGKSEYHQLRIEPLPPESAEELLDGLLGTDRSLEPVKRLLIDRTEGNPFFLEESVQTLVETGALVGERGAYRLAKASDHFQIPGTAKAILAARIDRLTPEDKQVLQTAAVIGKDVPFVLLQAIAESSEEGLRGSVGRLQAAEFLYESRLFPDLEYTFKHALTHEVTYAGLLQERRRAIHGRVVEAIERQFAERVGDYVEHLAHHAFHAGLWAEAARYLRQAAARTAARWSLREAVAHLEQALVALDHLPESRETMEQGVDVRLELRNVLLPLGEHHRILDHLQVGERHATALNDRRRLGWTSAYTTPHSWFLGDYEAAVSAGKRALAIADTLPDFPLQVMTNFFLSLAYLVLGNYRQAVVGFRRNIDLLQGDLLHERFGEPGLPSVFSRAFLAWCLAELGEFDEAGPPAEEALRIAATGDQPFTLMHALLGAGVLALRRGDLDKATPALERSLALCDRWDLRLWSFENAAFLGTAYALCGRLSEAFPLFERAVGEMPLKQVDHALVVGQLAEALLLAGRLEEASRYASQALDLAQRSRERGNEAYAWRLLAEVQSRGDAPDLEAAAAHYRDAMTLAVELGMSPLVAHCHLGLGKLHRRTGRHDQAHEHLTTATTMYRAMDMRFWLEQAEAEMRGLA